jgi:hypothetical protein
MDGLMDGLPVQFTEDDAHRAREVYERERDLEEHPLTSWDAEEIPADLSPEPPTVLRRTDGKALLYPGKTHSFVGEPEGGKTWMALAACQETLAAGGGVMYVDFEDSVKGVVRRLRALGVDIETVKRRFAYVRPTVRIGAEGAKHSLVRTGERYRPALIVLDGVTECMALHGWDINSATDAAMFLDWFPRLWERTGAAVVMIDHVVKSAESQGRWAIGSQHKLAGVNGASYTFEVMDVFGKGRHGRAKIAVAKDREGEVRADAHDGKVAGVFNLRGSADGSVRWDIEPYDDAAMLQTLADKIAEALADGPLNKTAVQKAVARDRNDVWAAIGELEQRGQVRVTKEGSSHMVALT